MNLLAELCLLVTRESTIILLFLGAYIFSKRQPISTALALLLFTMIYNHWLKSLWQIPLPASLGKEGWAFPSGHMHAAVAFYGYLLASRQSKIRLWQLTLAIALTAGVGWALVYKGYHYPADIWAALAFASVSISLLRRLEAFSLALKKPYLVSLILWLLAAGLHARLIYKQQAAPHLALAHGALLGCLLSVYVLSKKEWLSLSPATRRGQCLSLLVSLIGLLAFNLAGRVCMETYPSLTNFVVYFASAIWMLCLTPALAAYQLSRK